MGISSLISINGFCGEFRLAILEGALVKVKALLKSDPDLLVSEDCNGDTPLHWSASSGYKNVAELMLVHGVEVNAKNHFGHTPLHRAVMFGRKDVVELLYLHGGHE
jgi:ankyrin repeat protein